jgi:hypothetical protein
MSHNIVVQYNLAGAFKNGEGVAKDIGMVSECT